MYEERETITVYMHERRVNLWPLLIAVPLVVGVVAVPLLAPSVILPAVGLGTFVLAGVFFTPLTILAIGKARQLTRDADTRRIMAERLLIEGQGQQALVVWRKP